MIANNPSINNITSTNNVNNVNIVICPPFIAIIEAGFYARERKKGDVESPLLSWKLRLRLHDLILKTRNRRHEECQDDS